MICLIFFVITDYKPSVHMICVKHDIILFLYCIQGFYLIEDL